MKTQLKNINELENYLITLKDFTDKKKDIYENCTDLKDLDKKFFELCKNHKINLDYDLKENKDFSIDLIDLIEKLTFNLKDMIFFKDLYDLMDFMKIQLKYNCLSIDYKEFFVNIEYENYIFIDFINKSIYNIDINSIYEYLIDLLLKNDINITIKRLSNIIDYNYSIESLINMYL